MSPPRSSDGLMTSSAAPRRGRDRAHAARHHDDARVRPEEGSSRSVRRIMPMKFTSSVRRATSASKPSKLAPALFTRTSSPPSRSRVSRRWLDALRLGDVELVEARAFTKLARDVLASRSITTADDDPKARRASSVRSPRPMPRVAPSRGRRASAYSSSGHSGHPPPRSKRPRAATRVRAPPPRAIRRKSGRRGQAARRVETHPRHEARGLSSNLPAPTKHGRPRVAALASAAPQHHDAPGRASATSSREPRFCFASTDFASASSSSARWPLMRSTTRPAARTEQRERSERDEASDRARGHDVERAAELAPGRAPRRVRRAPTRSRAPSPRSPPQERRLLLRRLDERDAQIRPRDRERRAGDAAARSDVDEAEPLPVISASSGSNVSASSTWRSHALSGVLDGGEVHLLVHREQPSEVVAELGERRGVTAAPIASRRAAKPSGRGQRDGGAEGRGARGLLSSRDPAL